MPPGIVWLSIRPCWLLRRERRQFRYERAQFMLERARRDPSCRSNLKGNSQRGSTRAPRAERASLGTRITARGKTRITSKEDPRSLPVSEVQRIRSRQ